MNKINQNEGSSSNFKEIDLINHINKVIGQPAGLHPPASVRPFEYVEAGNRRYPSADAGRRGLGSGKNQTVWDTLMSE